MEIPLDHTNLSHCLRTVAEGLGHSANGSVVFVEGTPKTEEASKLLECLSEGLSETHWGKKCIENHFKFDQADCEEIQEYFKTSGAKFLNGDAPGPVDFLCYSLVKLWITTATNADKAKLKTTMAWYGKVGTSQYLKKPPSSKTDVRPLNDPTRWHMVIGRVTNVWEHENSAKLFCEEIDVGESEARQIGSGLREFISKDEFIGKLVVVLANLKPKKLGGFQSHGMVLCASNSDHTVVELLVPPLSAKVGDRVMLESLDGKPDEYLTSKKNADTISSVMEGLRTDSDCVASANGHKFLVRGEPVRSKSLANAFIN